MLTKKRVLSINVSSGSYEDFVETIFDYSEHKLSSYVCLANVHMLVEAHNSKKFQDIVNGADIVAPDGMPIAKSLGLFHDIKQDRVDGMGLMENLLARCVDKGQSVYFYGGTPQMLSNTQSYLGSKYPGLKVVGMYSPPFRDLTTQEKTSVIENITQSGANLVFVVLGCPKQEAWMNEMKGKLPAVMLGIGGALPMMIGTVKRAPKWMQKIGMEWFFRLIQEPRRLFKRYAVTNTMFIALVIIEMLKKRREPAKIATVTAPTYRKAV
jgi:N-acetylglucosaminyldiphosphoundecaprenol N-acetyl-beta-D-mannosaminyltransferase